MTNEEPHHAPTTNEEKKVGDDHEIHEARQGLLKALQVGLAPKFSSKPIDFRHQNSVDDPDSQFSGRSLLSEGASVLTESERKYLKQVLESNDPAALQAANARLKDPTLFPPLGDETDGTGEQFEEEQFESSAQTQTRRDSQVQQELFRLHETVPTVEPSKLLQRMSLAAAPRYNSILDSSENLSPPADHQTSLATSSGSWDMHNEDDNDTEELEDFGIDWDPFKDITSWLDGSEGVEVNNAGVPMDKTCTTLRPHKARPFKILGTSADDVSCHPHVLSPPLMESLLAFMPESLTDQNYWLKYSLVRDGASLSMMLRQVRASTTTLLAIETTDGHVLGSFTTDTWRHASGWYGAQDSYLWRMRHSRLEPTQSIVQKACHEGEIQVFPYRTGNVAVQYCDKTKLLLGQGELLPATHPGKHYGHGLYLDASLKTGSTSTSETFGNPCLTNVSQRGQKFQVANVEVWTLTPHETTSEAEQSELSTLFLDSCRSCSDKKLNLLGIMVGSPI